MMKIKNILSLSILEGLFYASDFDLRLAGLSRRGIYLDKV
jgi:hypothetical protein